MTSELRPAVEVWLEAYEASYYDDFETDDKAAAVIEADREAVRAEQAAELAKFKALAETLAGYAEHKGGCRRGLWPEITPTLPCDCGLSDAQRQYNEARNANPI